MSFPSVATLADNDQLTEYDARKALYRAFQTDTPLGFTYVTTLTKIIRDHGDKTVAELREHTNCAVNKMRKALENVQAGAGECVLRALWLDNGALKIDLHPDSEAGRQVARLLGTDEARSILEEELSMQFAFANCCGGIGDDTKKKGKGKGGKLFTAVDQIRWQIAPDC